MDEGTTDSLPRIQPPQRIGGELGSRYALYDEVGTGPLAHVYSAWDNQLSHRVAVKILDSRFVDHPQVVEGFEAESRHIANLPSHRSIVSIHSVEREGRFPYIVMEYVPGQSLRSILTPESPLGLDYAFDICRQVALGLDFAHRYGVVHGNIKPENILISRSGQVKVTDFGLGHVMDIAETFGAIPPLAHAGYMSPEQALGRQPGPASDIYSLGVILFEMLTGRLPFGTADGTSILTDYARGTRRDPQRLHPAIPPEAWRVLLRALAKNPEGRYRTAGAFEAALHEYLRVVAGSTAVNAPASAIDEALRRAGTQPSIRVSELPKPSGARPVARRGGTTHPRRITATSLAFVAALVVALAAGWLTYKGISELLKQWGHPAGAPASWTVKQLRPVHTTIRNRPHLALQPRVYRNAPTVAVVLGTEFGSYRARTAGDARGFTLQI